MAKKCQSQWSLVAKLGKGKNVLQFISNQYALHISVISRKLDVHPNIFSGKKL